MDPVIRTDDPADLEARRMELRGMIRLASEVIAQYWPMRTFVHHNPPQQPPPPNHRSPPKT